MMTYRDTPSPAMKAESSKGILVTARKRLKIIAPMRMRNSMAVVLADWSRESVRTLRLKRFVAREKISAPKAPAAAASVGVKTPK